ncbi:MAG TPA: cyclic nucleotide-binding domain-containing protein [Candidatus Sericytochromatia bacterium]|jgi:CRP-like cAMP-binding protein
MNYKHFRSFQYLDQTQLQNFVSACQRLIIPPGEQIVQQNSQGKKIFFILEGEVRVFLDTPTGEKELAQVVAPTVVGEISFFSGEPNSANVKTVTQVRALVMPFEVLRQRLQQGDAASSMVVLNMGEAIAQRASAMTRKISDLYCSQPDTQLTELQSTTKALFGEWSFL